MQERVIKRKIDKELYSRITAPKHVVLSDFKEHRSIDGYFENRDVVGFFGCDRLLKIDTSYATMQLGYSPSKGQSFVFANIKTSIYDTAGNRYQHELKEYQAKKSLKGSNENISLQSKQARGSAVVLYKAENKPWSVASVAPYLLRVNNEALQKTMPFLEATTQKAERISEQEKQRSLGKKVTESLNAGAYHKLADLRSEQNETLMRQNFLNSIITRKQSETTAFFRKINMAFDVQKHEMFEYYKAQRIKRAHEEEQINQDEGAKDEQI